MNDYLPYRKGIQFRRAGTKKKIDFSINRTEAAVLEFKMKEEGWTNYSGYIKSVLFADLQNSYQKMLDGGSPEDISNILKHLLAEWNDCITAMTVKYTAMAESLLGDIEVSDDERRIERANVIRRWLVEFSRKADQSSRELNRLARSLKVSDGEGAVTVPPTRTPATSESLMSSSPELIEMARQRFEELEKGRIRQ